MTRDEIIRMARHAIRLSVNDASQISFDVEETILDKYDFLYWFAKEVADAEREVCAKACVGMAEPVAYCTLEQLAYLKLTVPSDDTIAIYTVPPTREPFTEDELRPIRRRMMMEAYNAADDGDSERYNALKVMANDVLDMLLGVQK